MSVKAKGIGEGDTVDRGRVARDWHRRGFSCDLWVDPPGQVWEDYAHQTDELLMVLEGELQVEFQGHRLNPAIGEEVLIPAKAAHTVRNIGKATARWLYGYRR